MITFVEFCGLLMSLCSEPEVVCVAARRAPNHHETSAFQRLEAPTAIPCIPAEGLHQFLMATHDDTGGAVVIRCSPPQDALLPLGQAGGDHRLSPHQSLP
jgi:hypothetical protein